MQNIPPQSPAKETAQPTSTVPLVAETLNTANKTTLSAKFRAKCNEWKDVITIVDVVLKVLLTVVAIIIAHKQVETQRQQKQVQEAMQKVQTEQSNTQALALKVQERVAQITVAREQPVWRFSIDSPFASPLQRKNVLLSVFNEGEIFGDAMFHPQSFLLHTVYERGFSRCTQRLTPLPISPSATFRTRLHKGSWGTVTMFGLGIFFFERTSIDAQDDRLGPYEMVQPVVFVKSEFTNRFGESAIEGHLVSFSGSRRLSVGESLHFAAIGKQATRATDPLTKPTRKSVSNGTPVLTPANQDAAACVYRLR